MNTLEMVRTWWPVVATVFNVVFGLLIWALVKTFAKKEEFQALQASHKRLAERVDQMPDHNEISDLKISIEKLRGDIKEIRPKLDGLDRISSLLLENEIKEKN